ARARSDESPPPRRIYPHAPRRRTGHSRHCGLVASYKVRAAQEYLIIGTQVPLTAELAPRNLPTYRRSEGGGVTPSLSLRQTCGAILLRLIFSPRFRSVSTTGRAARGFRSLRTEQPRTRRSPIGSRC